MIDPTQILGRIERFYSEVEALGAGKVLVCQQCNRTQPVDKLYWREGWPTCCNGHTMSMVEA